MWVISQLSTCVPLSKRSMKSSTGEVISTRVGLLAHNVVTEIRCLERCTWLQSFLYPVQITVSVLWADIKIYSRIVDEMKPGSFGHITLLKWLCAHKLQMSLQNEMLNEKCSDGSTCDGNYFWIILTWFSLLVSRSLKWVPHKCKRMSNLAFHLFICVSSTKSFLPVWSFLGKVHLIWQGGGNEDIETRSLKF